MIVFPNIKINLGLNITEKRPDGYHNIETVFYPVNWHDELEINALQQAEEPYNLTMKGFPIEGSADSNLVIKAYKLLKNKYPQLPAVDLYLFKQVPMGAGLGGGSSDAAFMIKALNEKYNLGMTDEEMCAVASQLGADCAFFVKNTPVFATGIGNEFHPIDLSLKGYTIVLVKPDVFVSTKEAYSLVKPCKPQISITEIIQKPIAEWKALLKNDFEDSVFTQYPMLAAIKNKLYDLGAIYAAMSGSGSTLFGIFNEPLTHIDKLFEGSICKQLNLE